MADYLQPLPRGSGDGGAADSAATESVQPADYNRLVGVLNGTAGTVGRKFPAAMRGQQTITEAVLVSGVDPGSGEDVYVTLSANRVVGAPLNPVLGQRLHFVITENGTGGWTLTWNAVFSLTNWTLNTVAGGLTEATFTYNGTNWVLASNPPTGTAASPVQGVVTDWGGSWYNVKSPSNPSGPAKGDTQFITDGAMASASAILTSASNPFAATDVGKLITVPTAGALITPPSAPLVAADGGGTAATTLPVGSYTFVFTWTTGFGESTVGSSSVVYVQATATHSILFTFPAMPANAGAWKLYCTVAPAGGFTGLISPTTPQGTTTYLYTAGLTVNNANAAPGANTASTTLVTTIASFQSAGQVTLTAANASGATVSGSFVNWGTDDTLSIKAALTAAAPGNGEIEIPPVAVGYMISDELVLPVQAVQLRGGGVRSLYGNTASNYPVGVNVPTIAPYFTGSVLIQTATGKDGIKSNQIGPTLNIRDIGVRFTNWFAGTGHGFDLNPPALAGKQDQGLYDSIWSGLKVFGHDGNHYAYNLINCLYNVYHGLRGYGGGFINLAGNSTTVPCGNEALTNPYGVLMVAGTCHGINETAAIANGLIFTAWIRPQTWVTNVTAFPAFSGLTKPTAAQLCLSADGNVALQNYILPDFESELAASVKWPIGKGCFRSAGFYNVNSTTGSNIVQNNPVSGTSYQNVAGTGIMYTYTATLNPTAGAAATVLVEVSVDNITFAEVAKLSAPATGLTGQVQSLCFYVPPNQWFRVTLTNAAQQWTTIGLTGGAAS